MDTVKWCDFGLRISWAQDVMGYISVGGGTVTGDLWDVITALSSLLTNAVATTLIAFRAWCVLWVPVNYLRGHEVNLTQATSSHHRAISEGAVVCTHAGRTNVRASHRVWNYILCTIGEHSALS